MKEMIRFFFLLLIGFISLTGFGQDSPINWNYKISKTGPKNFFVHLEGRIAKGWKLFHSNNEGIGLEKMRLTWNDARIDASDITIKGAIRMASEPLFDGADVKFYSGNVTVNQAITINGEVPYEIKVRLHAFAADNGTFLPIEEEFVFRPEGGSMANDDQLPSINIKKPLSECSGFDGTLSSSLWIVFWKGFIGGLIVLFMPCIFPMLPVTVSFFMNRAKSSREGVRNGLVYGFFILLIYAAASIPFHIVGDVSPQIFNNIATNKWTNLIFFAVFILFAFSLFGLFELRLPGANSTDKRSHTKSIAGIFFMALTLAIVSFSCTGPILGFLLVNSVSEVNGAWALTAGMSGFGGALALPFGLFAMFPQWLKKLPRSGGWMETLKKSLAFVELALALKFLSNADLVEHWGLLKREVFIGIWIVITISLALYLLNIQWLVKYGKLNVSKGRLVVGALALLFAFFLVPGLTKSKSANLKWVSGFPPPLSYSIYGKDNVHGKGVEPQVVNDYDKAIALAKEQGKPLLIDFTGWACVNCRKMEENVWTSPAIQSLILNDFVLLSLYVDERTELPDGTTVGAKWANFQARNFGAVSQPQYVLLTPDELLINRPVGYSSVSEYKNWLQCGLTTFKQAIKN